MITAIILAGGEGKRAGKTKALLEANGEKFVDIISRKLLIAGLNDRIVVVNSRNYIEILKEAELKLNEKIAVNYLPYEAGQISSIVCGLKKVYPALNDERVMVYLVDMPYVKVETIRKLLSTARLYSNFILIPVYKGKRGHPVVIPSIFYSYIYLAPQDKGLHWVMDVNKDFIANVDVDDEWVVKDIDEN